MVPSTQLLDAGSHSAARGQDFPPHRHNCWELVFYRRGHIEVPIGGEVFRTHPGLMLCTPPGVVHSERAITAYANDFITLDASVDTPWPRAVADDSIGSLSYLCRALVAHSRAVTRGSIPSMLPLVLAQLYEFLCVQGDRPLMGKGEKVVSEAEKIFEERYALPLEIRRVASELGVAPSALRAHFASFRGYAPSEGLARVRLQRALALLRSSDLTLKEIAVASGFYSPSHLSRHVNSVTGQPPGKWRWTARGNVPE